MNYFTKMFIALFVALLTTTSFSQTTITLEEFMSVFTPGTHHYYTGDEGNQYNIGYLGGPQIFDYSYVDLQDLNISNNYSVGTISILAERYPSDAITIGETPTTIEKNPVFLVRGDSVFTLGQASLIPEYSFSHNVPYQLLGKFPATYGIISVRIKQSMIQHTTQSGRYYQPMNLQVLK